MLLAITDFDELIRQVAALLDYQGDHPLVTNSEHKRFCQLCQEPRKDVD